MELAAKWVPGTYDCSGVFKNESRNDIDGYPDASRQEATSTSMEFRAIVGPPDDKGIQKVALHFLRAVEEKDGRRFDTDDTRAPRSAWTIYPLLVKLVFRARIEPGGRLIEDGDDFGAALQGAFRQLDQIAPLSTDLSTELEKFRQSPVFKTPITNALGRRPFLHGSTKVGETWRDSQQIDLPFIGSVTMATDFKLEGVESTSLGEVARISRRQKIHTDSPSSMSLPGAKIVYEETTWTSTGTNLVSTGNDLVGEMETESDMVAKVRIHVGQEAAPGQFRLKIYVSERCRRSN